MKKTIILLLCAIFFLSACGPEGGNQVSVTEIEEGIPSSEAEEEEKNSMLNENNSYELQEQIVSARIEDVTEGAYQEELSVMLSEEEVSSLLDLSGGLYAGEMHSGSRNFFAVSFLDADGATVERWIVDASYQVQLEGGDVLSDSETLSSRLEEIAKTHGVTTSAVWNRAPAEKYLQDLEDAARINVVEHTETNFDEGADTWLSDSLIEELCKIQETIDFAEADLSDAGEIGWQIHIYDEYGAGLYDWTVYESGLIYSGTGYELLGGELAEWVGQTKEFATAQ